MGQLIEYTLTEKILKKLDIKPSSDEGITIQDALSLLREAIKKDIEDSRWYCPIHERLSSDNDCLECDDALSMNIIINNMLNMKSLQ